MVMDSVTPEGILFYFTDTSTSSYSHSSLRNQRDVATTVEIREV